MNMKVLGRVQPRWLALASLGVLVPALVYSAIDPGLFEIDGNAITTATDDWDHVALGTDSADVSSFIPDAQGAAEQIFTGGGSKDERDISGGGTVWQHTGGSTPPKDDLEHAYAAAYHNANNDLLVYFGADRTDNNGSSAVGFWFFQDSVSIGPGQTFTGKHTVGDILITSDYKTGGGVSVINVFKWVGGKNPLQLLISGSPQQPQSTNTPQCLQKSGVDVVCAISNRTVATVPGTWPGGYHFEGNSSSTFPISTFFEGGINITQLVGASSTCFTSFLAMTRTSPSTTAQLKDFVVGSFPLCGISVAKSCDGSTTISSDGEHFHNSFTVTITNTGTGTVFNPAFIETPALGTDYTCKLTEINGQAINPVVTLAQNTATKLANTLAAGASVTGTVACDTLDNPFDNSASAQAFATNPANDPNALKLTADEVNSDPQCTAFQFSGALAIEKKCANRFDPDGNLITPAVTIDSNLILKVCVDLKVTNNANQTVNGITITDDQVAASDLPAAFSLAPGASKSVSNACYTPSQGDDPNETHPHNVTFTDHASASGTGALSGDTVASSETSATCPLCLDPSEATPP